ncbi:MAG: hypothetical protein JST01_27705 [Cyanobacteria bacterium SZAS TMP-1]|nr:hypothetical protein [Cyanobacteria bacterium SZAS TMP-1]
MHRKSVLALLAILSSCSWAKAAEQSVSERLHTAEMNFHRGNLATAEMQYYEILDKVAGKDEDLHCYCLTQLADISNITGYRGSAEIQAQLALKTGRPSFRARNLAQRQGLVTMSKLDLPQKIKQRAVVVENDCNDWRAKAELSREWETLADKQFANHLYDDAVCSYKLAFTYSQYPAHSKDSEAINEKLRKANERSDAEFAKVNGPNTVRME